MARTRDSSETVIEKLQQGARFRKAVLCQAAELLLAGDLQVSKILLRDFIKATIGYRGLSKATETPEKSLIRMFGPSGNPRASHFVKVIKALQADQRVSLEVKAKQVDAEDVAA